MKKNLIVISAPSGSGKTTLCRELQKARPEWNFSLSYTTRPRRDYEKDGYDYEFVSEEEFSRRVKADALVEYEEVHGYLYGTPREVIESVLRNGDMLLLEVDVRGGISIKEAYPDPTLTIFIRPPSVEELKRRLRIRGSDSEIRITKRLERMEMEMGYESLYDYSVVNDNIERTLGEIVNIIESEQNE